MTYIFDNLNKLLFFFIVNDYINGNLSNIYFLLYSGVKYNQDTFLKSHPFKCYDNQSTFFYACIW